MEWRVPKTGMEQFDALHTYGLATLLASVYERPTDVVEEALSYVIRCETLTLAQVPTHLLFDTLCPLPTEELLHALCEHGKELQTCSEEERLALCTFDGLLAALLTFPQGIRCCSVADLLDKERYRPSALQDGRQKVQAQWRKWQMRLLQHGDASSDWLCDLLEEYRPETLRIPLAQPVQNKTDITVMMSIEPTLSYASRNPLSDARVASKTNITIRGTRCAVLLAYIGASRFLRAHHVSGDGINTYVPLARFLRIYPTTALPLLSSVAYSPAHALVLHWLDEVLSPPSTERVWRGWAYHMLQMQGKQQPLSRQRGQVESDWLHDVKKRVGHSVLLYWKTILSEPLSEHTLEQEELVDALLARRLSAWNAHLQQTARVLVSARHEQSVRRYRRDELQEMNSAMELSHLSPLSAILERDEGTLRFGHALRLLHQYNVADGSDALEELESVSTRDQLITVLGHAMQRCSLASAKSPFIVVPSDDDLKDLLDDIDRYSAHTLARVLILLASLHYPKSIDARTLWRLLESLLLALPLQQMDAHAGSEDGEEHPEGVL